MHDFRVKSKVRHADLKAGFLVKTVTVCVCVCVCFTSQGKGAFWIINYLNFFDNVAIW